MNIYLIFQLLAAAGLVAGSYGIYRRYREIKRRPLPSDSSPIKGNPADGVRYAFTAGMMPWAKESTRMHVVTYLRGIGFHLGIFLAIGALLASPFWGALPQWLNFWLAAVLAIGALLGAAGGVMRLADKNLRAISLPDDHFAVWLTTLFMLMTALGVLLSSARIPMYAVAALTFVYVPLGKIRHCLYFFFSRWFFGKFFGRRSVFPHPASVRQELPQ